MDDLSNNNQDSAESTCSLKINVDVDLAKAVGKLVSPVNKILEIFSSACGTIGGPLHKILDGKADAYVMEENAKVIEDHKGLPIEYSNKNIFISTKELDPFHQRMLQREWKQAEQREANVETIVRKAIEKVKNDPEVDTQQPDQDWLLRFFTSAQDISTEEMQDIWASVLAGTAKNSKAYSLRTLTTLHNMSKDDAELFVEVCSLRIALLNQSFIPRYDDSSGGGSISYNTILHLSECGLLNSSPLLSSDYSIYKTGNPSFVFNDEYLLCVSSKESRAKLQIPQYPLTLPGRELSSLFKQKTTLDDMKRFVTFIKEKNDHIIERCSLHKIIRELDGGKIEYESEPLLTL